MFAEGSAVAKYFRINRECGEFREYKCSKDSFEEIRWENTRQLD